MRGAAALSLAAALAAAPGPDSTHARAPAELPPRARRVLEMRAAQAAGDAKRLRAVLAPDSRVWFEARTGAGERRDPGGKDAFADWDRFFHAEKQVTYVGAAGLPEVKIAAP